MKKTLFAVLLAFAFLAGCGRPGKPEVTTAAPNEKMKELRSAERGVVALALLPHPLSRQGAPSGIQRALEQAARMAPCSAAVFHYRERRRAVRWLRAECRRRRRAGLQPRVVLVGHSWGATAAGEMAKRLLAERTGIVIQLLITVDAIKGGKLRSTTSTVATVFTLDNPLPGKSTNFRAYDNTPPVDGRSLLAHVNYYQSEPAFAHGGVIARASENHRIVAKASALNHGNIDDYAFPLILADLKEAVTRGEKP